MGVSFSVRRAVPPLLLGSLVPAALWATDSLLGFPWSGTAPKINFTFNFGLAAAGLACIAAGLWELGKRPSGGWLSRAAALLGLTLSVLGVLVRGATLTHVLQGTAALNRAQEAVFWAWVFLPLLLGAWLAWSAGEGSPRWPWLVFALSPLWWVLLTLFPSLVHRSWLLPAASPEDAGDLELHLSLVFLPWMTLAWALWQTSRSARQRGVRE